MGFENSLRTITEKEIIKAWIIGLSLQSNGSPQKQELSDDDNGSAECSIITIEMRREGTEMPESNIWILRDRINGAAWSVTDYILEQPAKCPNCWRDILEK